MNAITIPPSAGRTTITADERDLMDWSKRWPCSGLRGRKYLRVELDGKGDLVNLSDGCEDLSSDELAAFTDWAMDRAAGRV